MAPSPIQNTKPCSPFYQYEPLRSSATSIRLLRIANHKIDGKEEGLPIFFLVHIHCTPEQPPLQPYEAISWAWDAPSHRDTCTLSMNGTNLAISTNMYHIL